MRMGLPQSSKQRHLHAQPIDPGNSSLKQIISQELGERSNQNSRLMASGWKGPAKQSQCQYSSPQGTHYIDVLGFYSGVEMLEKTFAVDPSS